MPKKTKPIQKRVNPNYERKVKAIKCDYEKLNNQRTERGVKKYTLAYMLETLSNKYFLEEKTIYTIIKA